MLGPNSQVRQNDSPPKARSEDIPVAKVLSRFSCGAGECRSEGTLIPALILAPDGAKKLGVSERGPLIFHQECQQTEPGGREMDDFA